MRHGIASLLLCTILSTACATAPGPKAAPATVKPANVKEWIAQNRSRKKAVAGAVFGGLVGLASGLITGASPEQLLKRTVAGAVVGAVAGFEIGKHQDRVFAGRDLAARQARYDSSQGYLAQVEEVSFRPANLKPGQTAQLYVRYVVLGPDPNEALKIRVFRGLKYGEDYVFGAGPNEFVIPQGGGIVESTMYVSLPAKAPEGTYSIEAMLEDPQGRFPQVVGNGALSIVAQAQQRGGVATAAR